MTVSVVWSTADSASAALVAQLNQDPDTRHALEDQIASNVASFVSMNFPIPIKGMKSKVNRTTYLWYCTFAGQLPNGSAFVQWIKIK